MLGSLTGAVSFKKVTKEHKGKLRHVFRVFEYNSNHQHTRLHPQKKNLRHYMS
jgi:hypothetical protein